MGWGRVRVGVERREWRSRPEAGVGSGGRRRGCERSTRENLEAPSFFFFVPCDRPDSCRCVPRDRGEEEHAVFTFRQRAVDVQTTICFFVFVSFFPVEAAPYVRVCLCCLFVCFVLLLFVLFLEYFVSFVCRDCSFHDGSLPRSFVHFVS